MLFTDEDELQIQAARLANQLRSIPVPPAKRAAFINSTIIPNEYLQPIQAGLMRVDPVHHYVLLSYVRLQLGT